MPTMSLFNKTLLSTCLLLLLTACSNEEKVVKEKKTVLDEKINAVNMAKESVAAVNTKTEAASQVPAAQPQPAVEAEPVVEPQPAVQPKTLNASSLYTNKCASCHGTNAEKSALNASAKIAQWDAKKIEDALQGYKNGTYGSKMKAIMQAQSKPLSDEEIKALSDYIALF